MSADNINQLIYWSGNSQYSPLCLCQCHLHFLTIVTVVSLNRTMVNAAFTTIPEGAFSHLHLLQFL